MRLDELDERMRMYEAADGRDVDAEAWLTARLVGIEFNRLAEFDPALEPGWRKPMIETARHLMQCRLPLRYGFACHDELCLLLEPDTGARPRKDVELHAALAGEASAKFSLCIGDTGVFTCRLCRLPNAGVVVEYFRWRQEAAYQNALDACCRRVLHEHNEAPQQTERRLSRLSTTDKKALLAQHAAPFDELPHWQKHGIGLYQQMRDDSDTETDTALVVNEALPEKHNYNAFLRRLLGD